MPDESPVALVTGGARRIGAAIARRFHDGGFRVIVHYRRSGDEAAALAAALRGRRPDSAAALGAALDVPAEARRLADEALAWRRRLDVLVNNASGFHPTEFGATDRKAWRDGIDGVLTGAWFLSQALAPELARRRGAIVNLSDIHADRPLRRYGVYSIAKAGVKAMTRSLAIELAPAVRVNAVAPGAILWPERPAEGAETAAARARILGETALGRVGAPDDVAAAVFFLAAGAGYMTGQTLRVDGGRRDG